MMFNNVIFRIIFQKMRAPSSSLMITMNWMMKMKKKKRRNIIILMMKRKMMKIVLMIFVVKTIIRESRMSAYLEKLPRPCLISHLATDN